MYPEVLVFACNWDGWSCIETVTSLGLDYPASVKVVRVSCLSRVHTGLMLKAFEFGADGVMLIGCEQGGCNFGTNSEYIIKEYEKAQSILEMLGISKYRLVLVQLPAFDGQQFVEQVMKLTADITHTPAFPDARSASPSSVQDIGVQSSL